MARRDGKNIHGVLNDIDLSPYRDHRDQYSSQCTGTIPFLALNLHNKKPPTSKHLYRHDLESFFYVFLFVVCSYDVVKEGDNFSLRRDDERRLVRWLL